MKVRRNSYGGYWVSEGTDESFETDAIVTRPNEEVLFCWDCFSFVCVHVKAVGEFEATEGRFEATEGRDE